MVRKLAPWLRRRFTVVPADGSAMLDSMGSRARFALLGCALLAGFAVTVGALLDREAADAAAPRPHGVEAPLESTSEALAKPSTGTASTVEGARVALEGAQSPPAVRSKRTRASRLDLEPDEALVRVRILASETDEPVPGVRLMLLQGGSGGGIHVERARARLRELPRTGDDGWVEFIVPELQEFDVQVQEHGETSLSHVPPLARGETREFVLRVPTQDDLVFFGRVVAAEDGTPLRGASAILRSRADSASPELSDANGFFALRGASWRDDNAEVRAPGFAPAIFAVVDGHSSAAEALELRLQRAASLLASVTDPAGNPVARAGVVLSTDESWLFLREPFGPYGSWSGTYPAWTAMTDEEGRCAVEGLPPSVPLSVQVHVPGSKPSSQAGLMLQPGEVREAAWTAGGGTDLRGVILDQFGQPVMDQRILLLRQEPGERVAPRMLQGWEDPVAEATSDAEGRFTLPGIAPGTWLIGPAPRNSFASGFQPLVSGLLAPIEDLLGEAVDLDEGGKPLEIQRAADLVLSVEVPHLFGAAGEPPEEQRVVSIAIPIQVGPVSPQEVLLRAERGLYIRGRVLDSKGAPVEGVVTGYPKTKDVVGLCASAAAEGGSFTLGPLLPGQWSLTASWSSGFSGSGAHSEPVLAVAGERDVVLRLPLGCRIEGEVVDGARGLRRRSIEVTLCPRAEVWMDQSYGSDTASEFDFEGLVPGTYAILARAGRDEVGWLAGIELTPGEERTGLRIPLVPGARLRVWNRSTRTGYLEVRMEGYSIELLDGVAGESAWSCLPGGRAEIRLLQDEGEEPIEIDRIEVDLVAGEEREVAFEEERR